MGEQTGPQALQDVPLSAEPFSWPMDIIFLHQWGNAFSNSQYQYEYTVFFSSFTHTEMLQRTQMCRIHSNKIRKNRLRKKQYHSMEQQGNAKEIVILQI